MTTSEQARPMMSGALHLEAVLFEQALDAALIAAFWERLWIEQPERPVFAEGDLGGGFASGIVDAGRAWEVFTGQAPLFLHPSIWQFIRLRLFLARL